MSDLFNEEIISQATHTKWAGKTVHFARETDSTNLWIKRLAKEGASEGTLALAEFQSAGRGRLGRSGGFYARLVYLCGKRKESQVWIMLFLGYS